MKWFKHDSNAIKDEKIQLLMEEHGIVGYGIYFIICELCAEKIDKKLTPEIRIGWLFVEQLTHCRRSTIKRVLASSSTGGLLLWEPNEQLLICSIPNLLKRLDNWTRDLVVTTKQLPSKEEEVRSKELKNKKKETANAENDLVFFESLKTNQAYKHIDLNTELCKMDAWLSAHAGRKKTKRFVLNWLNKIEVPLPTEDIPDSLRRFIK